MLLCKNVIVNGRRTSMRLDRETWISLSDICASEGMTIHELCSLIDRNRGRSGLSSATRLFVLVYFRSKLNQYEEPMFTPPPGLEPSRLLKKTA